VGTTRASVTSFQLLTVAMAAELLKVPAKSVYALLPLGLPHVRIGRRVRIPEGELVAWIEAQKAEA
jgi:excisionase family DNA binding protein